MSKLLSIDSILLKVVKKIIDDLSTGQQHNKSISYYLFLVEQFPITF